MFQTLALTGADRVNAIHTEFADRESTDVLEILILVGLGVVVLFAVLLLANFVQGRARKRREAQHRAELEAQLRRHKAAAMRR